MSVFVPNHLTISPPASRMATARARCQRIGAVRRPPQPEFDLVRLARPQGRRPALDCRRQVALVDELAPAPAGQLVEAATEVLEHALVHVIERTVRQGRPHLLRDRIAKEAVSLLVRTLESRQLLLLDQRVLPPDLDRLLPEVDEDRHLRPQDVRVERLHQIVHGSGVVAAEDVLCVLGDRRQKQDRDVTGPLTPLDQLRRLEPVQPRHLDVEQDRSELFVEQMSQRLLAGCRENELLLERLEERLERQQVLGPVVDKQQLCARSLICSTTRRERARSPRAAAPRRPAPPRSPPPASTSSSRSSDPGRSRHHRSA